MFKDGIKRGLFESRSSSPFQNKVLLPLIPPIASSRTLSMCLESRVKSKLRIHDYINLLKSCVEIFEATSMVIGTIGTDEHDLEVATG